MLITEELFASFIKCETQSFLKAMHFRESPFEFLDLQHRILDDYKEECWRRLAARTNKDDCLVGNLSPEDLRSKHYALVVDCTLGTERVQSRFHALERSPAATGKRQQYIPIRFVPPPKISKYEKLQLGFDALVISMAAGEMPVFGRIIHGVDYKTTKIDLSGLVKLAKAIVERLNAQVSSETVPELILNRHCIECEFQQRCRQVAEQKDELSLLARMTEKERTKQHSRGIFTVTQLSHTFRPRRRPKRLAGLPKKHDLTLQALAIREHKIHIVGKPEFRITGTPVYLDVESVPDRQLYYLIGLRTSHSGQSVQHSYWADDPLQEREIWSCFLRTLSTLDTPQLIHYGSHEKQFLKRMIERYGLGESRFSDSLIDHSLNLLSIIYGSIYFPTYSNGLKEISRYLGFAWSDASASGLQSLTWRAEWEFSKDDNLRQRLITYNSEDCKALERLASIISRLCDQSPLDKSSTPHDDEVVNVDSIQREYPQRFGKIVFALPELESINKAAYWDYQRSRVYVRTEPRLKQIVKRRPYAGIRAGRPNRTVALPQPPRCPGCDADEFYKHGRYSKTVYDLRFGRSSIRRWVVKYRSHRYRCFQCKTTFWSEQWLAIRGKIGPNLISYAMYQVIELKLPQRIFALSMKQLFGLDLSRTIVGQLKTRAARIYRPTYDAILKKLASGHLLHTDETKINIAGGSGYVWVFTNLEEVAFYYTETREAEVLQTLFSTFGGVLVSDFYNAYDSMTCPQQKCLIHLIRDLNEDLRKQPFNIELSKMVREFSAIMQLIVETIDRFGLKTRFLRKHKRDVERFFFQIANSDFQSETVIKYQRRFEKNRDRLFTFLDFDGVPWNNNNAEHAIKSFALLRNVVRGSSSPKGMREYAILLSICETCKYKGINFLDFLRSGRELVSVR
jgi:predicted RecB family nuclease